MYLTNDKQRHRVLIGSYNTRKWNDYSSLIYFEKIYGGKPLLKKIKSIGLENNIEFHSAMVRKICLDSGYHLVGQNQAG